ncbi:MAG: CopD family protein [Pseudomonadota bacterium]
MYYLALAFHVLAAAVWVGGMFFAYALLRPSLNDVSTPERLTIWATVLGKFFPWVFLCIAVLFVSGFVMITRFGGFDAFGKYVPTMLAIAIVMTVIFKFIVVAPFRHLKRGVAEQKWEVAAYALGTIRKLVAVNLTLGILTIIIATALKAW